MQEQYITHLEKQARLELEKTRLFYRAVIVGEIMATLTAIVYIISQFYK